MRSVAVVFVLTLSMVYAAGPAVAAEVVVGRFNASASQPPAPWRIIRFDRKVPATAYRVITWDGVQAVEARADASMALIARPIDLDLVKTPILCWRWRIEAPLKKADMTKKSADDYAARVYVTFKLPSQTLTLAERSRRALARQMFGADVPDAAINYVWDNRKPIGTRLPSPYMNQSEMIVLRSGGKDAGRWVSQRRDLLADATQTFGTTDFRATLIAIGSDTDNTRETAHAGFAELRFVSRDMSCE
ncbi:MAG: DUF3047 domain-containing protein [Hyphomonadaceae bacterium]|jgi:hypothetical protein|uniref:DUF3047 domain-containing protein n=1 Tax=Aquidulcibacter sp. TaxID=2052990 RepID=UPI0026214C4E|nr:DUF3047 domain-containing protein [Aquidulcibacter sp.]